MTQGSLFDPPPQVNPDEGRRRRDAGTAQVDANTAQAWRDAADRAITRLAATGRPFTADDVRAQAGDPPGHPNALGARFLAARRSGLLEEVGYVRSTRPDAHARRLVTYRGAQEAHP